MVRSNRAGLQSASEYHQSSVNHRHGDQRLYRGFDQSAGNCNATLACEASRHLHRGFIFGSAERSTTMFFGSAERSKTLGLDASSEGHEADDDKHNGYNTPLCNVHLSNHPIQLAKKVDNPFGKEIGNHQGQFSLIATRE
jgi:hypothetical protein